MEEFIDQVATSKAYQVYPLKGLNDTDIETHCKRTGYYLGYKQAMKEIIEKAMEWVDYNNNTGGCQFDGWENDLRDSLIDV